MNLSYKNIIDIFQQAADQHLAIKSFATGPIDWLDNPQNIDFPLMFARPLTSQGMIQNNNGTGAFKAYQFEIYMIDVPHLTDGDENTKILSDTEQYMMDILAYFNFGIDQQNIFITQKTITPIWEAFNDRATGWVMLLEVKIPYYLDYCNYPS
jgi:hypothetical protein